ncbi:putative transcription repressor NiaR [Ruminococcaceae bacterium BL-6]|jgi:hypothetical protein|nr:putative transcription repressor NiaR [Ruminococcaceae bacterium BL-6]HBN80862.1 DNA-binding protein [Oscillospiraceae bacterium]
MNSAQRREKILELLKQNTQPVSAGSMAKHFHVSRQIIVGDVALLRAANAKIAATPRGYVMQTEPEDGENRYIIACRHTKEQLKDELYTVVDNGGTLVDVMVEHPLYGQISGQLHISSRFDADNFLDKMKKSRSSPLLSLTGGIHLHTVTCGSRENYDRIVRLLDEKGILLKKSDPSK